MEVSVTLGSDERDGINVTLGDDNGYCPEVAADWCKRAGDEALRLHAALHPAAAGEDR